MRRISLLLTSTVFLAGSCASGEVDTAARGTSSASAAPASPTGATPAPASPTASRFPSFDDAEAVAASDPVTIAMPDGVTLEGRLFGSGDVGVVLAHMRPGDQSQWWGFAPLLAEQGYRVLTFNRRGTCPRAGVGCSGGTGTGNDWKDLEQAVQILRDAGSRRLVVGGASLGAMESLFALSRGLDADGLVWVSGYDLYGLVPATRQVRDVTVPKLFVAGEGDTGAAALLPELERAAPPPTTVLPLATSQHGTDILAFGDPPVADELRQAVLDFLATI